MTLHNAAPVPRRLGDVAGDSSFCDVPVERTDGHRRVVEGRSATVVGGSDGDED